MHAGQVHPHSSRAFLGNTTAEYQAQHPSSGALYWAPNAQASVLPPSVMRGAAIMLYLQHVGTRSVHSAGDDLFYSRVGQTPAVTKRYRRKQLSYRSPAAIAGLRLWPSSHCDHEEHTRTTTLPSLLPSGLHGRQVTSMHRTTGIPLACRPLTVIT